MSKHTPGPWIVEPDRSGYFDVIPASGKGWAIVGCEGIDNQANATLIAAAPDLLDALQLAREELAGLPHSLGYSFTHLPKIDAALAKAKGVEQ